MSIPSIHETARILPFPTRRPAHSQPDVMRGEPISSRRIREDATVISFPAMATFTSGLTAKERAELFGWEASSELNGFFQVTICDASAGELVLIYCKGELWILEVSACSRRRFALRRRTSQSKAREFATITEALNAALAEPAVERRALCQPIG